MLLHYVYLVIVKNVHLQIWRYTFNFLYSAVGGDLIKTKRIWIAQIYTPLNLTVSNEISQLSQLTNAVSLWIEFQCNQLSRPWINKPFVIEEITCRSPWVVHGAYESALVIHSRAIFWYKERIVATQAGSLTWLEGSSLWTEIRSKSKHDEFHKTCR